MANELAPRLFQRHPSAAVSPGCDLFSLTGYYNRSSTSQLHGGMLYSGTGVSQRCTDSPSSLLLESVPGSKHDAGLSVYWSFDEQRRLEEGLAKYASIPSFMRYIKIAASLRDKTVRDVAIRCKWMKRKKRKQEDQKLMTKKATRHLLEENNQTLSQISANLSALKLQQNIDLFFRAKRNLNKVLNDMRNMPGIMSQMHPLPLQLNEELANTFFSPASSALS